MSENHNTHVKRIIILLVVAIVLGLIARKILTPSEFGKYGHYRAGAVTDEMEREVRHMTNDSCLSCHPYIKEMHLEGVHKTVSCEFCHGPLADHVKDGAKVAALPMKKGPEIKNLCMRCHNRIISARPQESIKMITMPLHLEEKKVDTEHICDQCHNVHSPMLYVNQAKRMFGLLEEDK